MDFKAEIAGQILKALGESPLTADEIAGYLEVPPDTKMGDYAFPCFKLSKALHKSPIMISDQLAADIHAGFLSRVESVKGYLNFFIDKATYAREIVDEVMEKGQTYGADDSGKGRTITIDYSSINIAKRFHIGHLSTTMIGASLKRIYEFFGYNVVGINHLGDWGTQFGKMIAAYKRWGDYDTVVSGGPLLVEHGRVHVRTTEEKMAADIARGRAPRTALGIKKDGTLLMVVVDGRSNNSAGLTLAELATYMLRLGAREAVNFDGGGSSVMAINGQVVNKPSDGKERPVSIGLGLFAR